MGVVQLVRKAAKPFAMAAIAGTLGLSLIITTPSNAQAFVPPPVLPAVWGATTMAIPSLMPTAAVLGPVGWGILGVTALGIGLYASKDYWLPYVTGLFGQPEGEQPSETGGTGAGYGTINPAFELTGLAPTGTTGRSVLVQMAYACETSSCSMGGHIATRYMCKNPTTGTTSEIKVVITLSATITPTSNLSPVTLTCNTGLEIVGAEVGTAGDGNLPLRGSHPSGGPFNHMYWGNLLTGGFDPRGADVTYRSETECIASDGTYSTVTAFSKGDEGGLKMASCEAAGKGHGTGKVTVWATPPGGAPEKIQWQTERATEDPAQPLCSPSRPSSGCKLGVSLDGKPCVMGNVECENWSELRNDPNHSTRLSCQNGPYQVSMDTCNPLERAYEPGGAPATEPNTDGNPGTRFDKQPDGSTQPKPSTDPNAPPLTGTIPGVGGQPGPSSSPNEAGCFPQGWAMFNPVEWVMKPVGCALSAAFVPNPATVQARTNSIQTKFQNVGFARISTAWLSTFEAAGGGSGCTGPTVNFNMSGVNQTLQPFNACAAPMSTVAGVSYGVSAIAMVLFGGLGIARAIAAGFGFNFSMGKGSDV